MKGGFRVMQFEPLGSVTSGQDVFTSRCPSALCGGPGVREAPDTVPHKHH